MSEGTLAVPPSQPRRLAFLGTPQWAVPTLDALVAAGFEVALVVTGPDRRRGRGRATSPTPVRAAAERHGLPVAHEAGAVPQAGVDLGVVVAFGHLLPRSLLEVVPMVNLHFSLLPRWRGAAPVQRAVLAGDEQTGVCVMAVEEGLDTGGVHASAQVPIDPEETVAELGTRLAALGADLMVRTLQGGLGVPEPQVGEPSYAHKLTADDLRLDWSAPAAQLARVVRVGGAWTTIEGRRVKVHRATACPAGSSTSTGAVPGQLLPGDAVAVQTGDGLLQLREVQPEGKGRQDAAAWRRGLRGAGLVLGS